MAGLSEGRVEAVDGTPSLHPDGASRGRAHLAAQVRWVHRDSPNQPLDIHRPRFPIAGRWASMRNQSINQTGSYGDILLKMKSKEN